MSQKDKMIETLKLIKSQSTEPLHNRSLTLLLQDGLINWTGKGMGYEPTEDGLNWMKSNS